MTRALTVSIDAMGGDAGPGVVVSALLKTIQRHTDVNFILHGDEAQLKPLLARQPKLKGLRPMLQDINVVSAPLVAKERGIVVEEVTREGDCDYESLITVTVETERQSRKVSGTVFADGRPRIVNIKGIRMDAEFGPSMIYITNLDKPGFIGKFSGTLGEAGINIATFHVGREAPGGNAIALIEIDGDMPLEVLEKVKKLPQVQSARTLKFDPLPPSPPAARNPDQVARLERSEMRPG